MRPDRLRWGTSESYVTRVTFYRVFVQEGQPLQLSPNETVKKVDFDKGRMEFGVIVMRTLDEGNG